MNPYQHLPMPVVLDADIIARIIDRIAEAQEAEAQKAVELPQWLENLAQEYDENFKRAELDPADMPQESPDAVWGECPF